MASKSTKLSAADGSSNKTSRTRVHFGIGNQTRNPPLKGVKDGPPEPPGLPAQCRSVIYRSGIILEASRQISNSIQLELGGEGWRTRVGMMKFLSTGISQRIL